MTPADRLVDATEAAISVGVRELCCRLGVAGRSFARSADNLKQAAQITLSAELLRGVVESEGKAVLKASADEQLEIDWSAADCKTRTPEGQEVSRAYASGDGVMVPATTDAEKQKRRATVLLRRKQMPRRQRRRLKKLKAVKKGSDQRYKQVYVTIFHDQDQEHRLVGLTRKDHKGLKKLLGTEAARVRLRTAAERVGLVDGAVCLRTHLESLPLQKVLLDFYHLSEHVSEAGRKTLGETTAEQKTRDQKAGRKTREQRAVADGQKDQPSPAQQWAEDVLHTLKHEGYKAFFQKLVDWRSGLPRRRRKAADQLLNYVAAREEMMDYAAAIKLGWHIGSGPIESMCGVTTDRIKGRGRRWDMDNAEAVMALEALYQSGLWKPYWDKVLLNMN